MPQQDHHKNNQELTAAPPTQGLPDISALDEKEAKEFLHKISRLDESQKQQLALDISSLPPSQFKLRHLEFLLEARRGFLLGSRTKLGDDLEKLFYERLGKLRELAKNQKREDPLQRISTKRILETLSFSSKFAGKNPVAQEMIATLAEDENLKKIFKKLHDEKRHRMAVDEEGNVSVYFSPLKNGDPPTPEKMREGFTFLGNFSHLLHERDLHGEIINLWEEKNPGLEIKPHAVDKIYQSLADADLLARTNTALNNAKHKYAAAHPSPGLPGNPSSNGLRHLTQ